MSELIIERIPAVTTQVRFDDEITEDFEIDEVALIFVSINKGDPQIAGSVFGDTVFWLDAVKNFNIAGKTASDIISDERLHDKPHLFHDEFILPLMRAFEELLYQLDMSLGHKGGDTMENEWNGEIIHHEDYQNYEISLA